MSGGVLERAGRLFGPGWVRRFACCGGASAELVVGREEARGVGRGCCALRFGGCALLLFESLEVVVGVEVVFIHFQEEKE